MHPKRLRLDRIALTRGGNEISTTVSIDLNAGGLVCLMGPNGSGKTTLLRQIAGVSDEQYVPEHFRSFYLGHSLPFYAGLSVRQQLKFWTSCGDSQITSALAEFDVESCADKLFGRLSKGQQQRVALSMLCLNKYDIWLLDEPTQNLDAQSSNKLYNLIQKFLQSGGMAIMASHQELPRSINYRKVFLEK